MLGGERLFPHKCHLLQNKGALFENKGGLLGNKDGVLEKGVSSPHIVILTSSLSLSSMHSIYCILHCMNFLWKFEER